MSDSGGDFSAEDSDVSFEVADGEASDSDSQDDVESVEEESGVEVGTGVGGDTGGEEDSGNTAVMSTSGEHEDTTEMASIPVPSKTSEKPGAVDRKINYCPVCSKATGSQFSRHLNVHKDDPDVKRIKAIKDKTERRRELDLFRTKGNVQHNMQVLKGDGNVKLVTKSSRINQYDLDKIAECPGCHGCYSKDNLYKHRKRCPGLTSLHQTKTHSQRVTLDVLAAASKDPGNEKFLGSVMAQMRKDQLYEIIHADPLIKHYGTRMYAKYSHLPHLVNYVSQKTREIARLVQSARKLKPDVNWDLRKLMNTDHWDLILASVKDAAGFIPDQNKFEVPSLALKLGYTLNRVSNYESTLCITKKNSQRADEIKQLKKLLAIEYPEEISRKALETLHVAKFNAVRAIPLSEDIELFYKFLKTEIGKKMIELKEDMTNPKIWHQLARVTLSYLIVFNRRRPGELCRLTLADYAKKSNGYVSDDVAKALSKSEILLAKSMTLVEIRGKRDNKVPVLINKLNGESIDLLIRTRTSASVMSSNIYVFALPGNKSSCVRASDAIREASDQCGAQEPNNLRCTKLRKHVATTCQILHMDENDQEQLAGFLGHDLKIHKEFYRLPSGALQLARLSKIFTLMDRGQISSGKNLALAEMNVAPDDAIDVNYNASSAEDEDEPEPPSKKRKLQKKRLFHEGSEEELSEPECQRPSTQKIKSKKPNTRKEWTTAERAAVKKHLAKFIIDKKLPGKEECESVLKAEKVLRDRQRTWSHVKFFVKNLISRSSKGKPLLSPLKVSPLKLKARHPM